MSLVPEADQVGGAVLLSVRHLAKRFGGVVALDDVSFEVRPGAVLGVIGPNGAGKSTLLKAICGECTADAGEVCFDDVRIDRLPRHRIARRGVALAHQVPRPFPELTVRDNVTVGALAGRDRHGLGLRDHVEDVLDATDLRAKATMPAGALGVVDLKRLELARALSLSPRLLLLDEVGAGLVESELESMIALVERIRARGATIVIVEHVEKVIAELADHVLVLDWGRIVTQGEPAGIAADPKVKELYLGTGARPARTNRPARRRGWNGSRGELLVVEDVSADYGGAHALRHIDLEVGAGEVVALVGANGAGKSTLAQVISGFKVPSGGRVVFDGRDVTRLPAHRRVDLGIAHAHEGRRIFGELTVRENLDLGAYSPRARAEANERRAAIHDLFPELAERQSQRGGTLSGGQQQMLAIARALMSTPRLLVLDEVSLGLAPVMVDRVYEALEAIAGGGLSILLVEQNVRRSLAMADRAYVLDHGVVSFAGAPEELDQETRLLEAYFGRPAGRAPRDPAVVTAKGKGQ